MVEQNAQNSDPVRTQGPRRQMGNSTSSSEGDRARENSVGDFGNREFKKSSAPWGKIIGGTSAVFVAATLIIGMNQLGDSDGDEATMGTKKPINYSNVETTASLYCYDAPTLEYGVDYEAIHDKCVKLVLSEIRGDEEKFRRANATHWRNDDVSQEAHEFDEFGYDSDYITSAAIESVLGDPENFLKSHGYTTTTPAPTTTTLAPTSRPSRPTSSPTPTYEEPEPTYQEPSSGSTGTDAGNGGGGAPLEWRTIGPFGGRQGCEYSASQQPLAVSECYVGDDNLFYFDSKVQARR